MAGERNLWTTLRGHMQGFGVWHRVENSSQGGTLDVAFCCAGITGWMELKALDDWPVRLTTPIRVSKLTLEQVLWMEAWSGAGGLAVLLLQVAREYLLLDTHNVRILYDRGHTKASLRASALTRQVSIFPASAILGALRRASLDRR